MDPEEPEATNPEADEFTPKAYGQYLTAEVMLLPHGGEMEKARVVLHKWDAKGKLIGTRNPNPILDTCLYEVDYPDGSTKAVAANLIAENLYAQVDEEGRRWISISESKQFLIKSSLKESERPLRSIIILEEPALCIF